MGPSPKISKLDVHLGLHVGAVIYQLSNQNVFAM